jgi:hypothetical protein
VSLWWVFSSLHDLSITRWDFPVTQAQPYRLTIRHLQATIQKYLFQCPGNKIPEELFESVRIGEALLIAPQGLFPVL